MTVVSKSRAYSVIVLTFHHCGLVMVMPAPFLRVRASFTPKLFSAINNAIPISLS